MSEQRRRRRAAPETKEVPSKMKVMTNLVSTGEEEEEEYELEVHRFEVEPAYVHVKAGVTKSPQQYESVRIDVSVSVPCYREQIEDTIPRVSDMVYDALTKEVDAYMGEEDGEE